MLTTLGNTAPKNHRGEPVNLGAPSVTRLHIPDEYTFDEGVDVAAFKDHLKENAIGPNPAVTQRPDDEALLALLHSGGAWNSHSFQKPKWVWSDNPRFAEKVAEFYGGVLLGEPDDLEDTHWTPSGAPGVVPGAVIDLQALFTDVGRQMQAWAMGGNQVGLNGVSTTAPTSTTYTLDGASAPGSTSKWNGMRIVAGSTSVGCVWGIIKSNTNVSSPVVTVDRWYNSATPGGAAATTPLAGPWVIVDGSSPAWFVGLTSTNITPAHGDTSLSGEITTSGGGLIRKIAPFALTSGVSPVSWTLTPVYTANGSDSLPVTIYAIGVFLSMVSSDTTNTMVFETSLSASATLSASGDQLTVTETVSGS